VFRPTNFDKGDLLGFEVEARTALDVFWKPLAGLAVGFNYTKLDSSVNVPPDVQEALAPFELDEEERPLQGQPAFLFNANITYDNDRTGTSVALFLNRKGDTLLAGASRGEAGIPNVFELERSTLDFTFRQRIKHGLTISFKARNLLEEDEKTVFRLPDGREGTRTLRETPLIIGLSLNWKL
jgi:outer membrane receptor protein involved in Fe transport